LDRAAVLAQCRGLTDAEETFPFGDDPAVFKVGGKIFALVSLGDEPGSISLKCDPGYATALREQYAAVTPGYHLNKRHWNTVRLDGSVPSDVLAEWIDDAYDLIVASLPRRARPSEGPRPSPR
jgi:predicted DNA-binding protein (MmcQ/YjbR family)